MTKRLFAAALVLLVSLTVRSAAARQQTAPQRKPLSAFPEQIGSWHEAQSRSLPSDVTSILRADDYLSRLYVDGQGHAIDLFIAYYTTQRAGESMHSPKNCLPGSGWTPVRSDTILAHSRFGDFPMNRYVIENAGVREAAFYWYQSGTRAIASEYAGKFYLVYDAMRTGRRDGAIVRIVVPISSSMSLEQATEQAKSAAEATQDVMSAYIPR